MILKKKILFLLLYLSLSCSAQVHETRLPFHYSGRVEHLTDNKVLLIGSASSVSFYFEGNYGEISLQSVDSYEHHNYVSIELDGEYIGRVRIEKGAVQHFPITVTNKNKKHHVKKICILHHHLARPG